MGNFFGYNEIRIAKPKRKNMENTPRAGRPLKDGEKTDKRVVLYFTETQLREIEDHCHSIRQKVGTYIKGIFLNQFDGTKGKSDTEKFIDNIDEKELGGIIKKYLKSEDTPFLEDMTNEELEKKIKIATKEADQAEQKAYEAEMMNDIKIKANAFILDIMSKYTDNEEYKMSETEHETFLTHSLIFAEIKRDMKGHVEDEFFERMDNDIDNLTFKKIDEA